MTLADPPATVLLGPGFLGGWVRGEGAREVVRLSDAALATGDPIDALAALRARHEERLVAGYLAYEVGGTLERRLRLPPPPAFDGTVLPALLAVAFDRAVPTAPPAPGAVPPARRLSGEGRAEGEAYRAQVAEVVRRILRGDLFQANLSRRLSAAWDDAPASAALFARLIGEHPAPYAALIDTEEGAVLSNSPELLLRVEGDRVAAEPIKGTRPRGGDAGEDAALAAALLASEKDRAENVMIADLLRNDLSRVARDGSMDEVAVCALRTLPQVHHLYSRIEARLRPGLGPLDALRAAFPCGSVTGAPKVAAMEAIAALEGEGRGPYCGTVFALPPGGGGVFSVAIRTGVLTRSGGRARLDVRAGGGVTALSDPVDELAETEDKAYPFRAMTGRA